MKKLKFKDVAHLYIGCKIKTKEGIGTLDVYYSCGSVKPEKCIPITSYDLVKSELMFKEVKPILKPLAKLSIVDGEALGWADIENLRNQFYADANLDEFTALEFQYLLSKGYDLFQLIETGEALEDKCNS